MSKDISIVIYIRNRPDGIVGWVEHLYPGLGDWGDLDGPRGFNLWSSQTNDFKIGTCHFLAWCSALLVYGKDWLTQHQDNVIERDIR